MHVGVGGGKGRGEPKPQDGQHKVCEKNRGQADKHNLLRGPFAGSAKEKTTGDGQPCDGAYAAQHPDLFDRLGLLASTVPIEHFELDKLDALHSMFLRLFRRDPRLFVMVGRLGIRGVQKAPESFFARLAKGLCEEDRAILNNPDILQRTIKCMRRSHFQGARILIEEYLRMQKPWQVDLGKIRIPVMQWHGEDDRIISIGSARGLASELPDNRFRSFPGKGRFMVYSVWKAFLSELLELPAGAAES